MTTDLDFRVLGPLRVLRDGEVVALGGTRQRAVLAMLVSSSNRVVSTAAIADAVWEDDPPPSVATSIQVAISALRSALGDRKPARLIKTIAPGYLLELGPDQSDLARFRALRARAARAHTAGRLDDAAQDLRNALDQWSGAAYDDLTGMRFAAAFASALEDERLATLEARIELDLALGRHGELVVELGPLTAEHPLRESLWAHYMLALYRCGRQADALAAYRRLRATLQEELGLEPSHELRALELALLAQEPRLDQRRPESIAADTTREGSGVGVAELVDDRGDRIPIGPAGLRIGRQESNDLVLDDPNVSRSHAVIRPTGEHWLLVDLRSMNGTRVNGSPVHEQVLRDNDDISIGSRSFRFVLGASEP